jgi:hypothetical protein
MGLFIGILIILYATVIGLYVVGEHVACKKPLTRFSKWWRKNVVTDKDLEDDNDHFLYM